MKPAKARDKNMSELILPVKILKQHLIALGKTGAGKSSVLRHIAEYLLEHGKRLCIIDPKGDWWGVKFSADGKSEGFPIIAFGDFKEPKASDVPINAQSGKEVAELIATGNRPCVIGFRGWMTGQVIRFWIDFASTLFNKNAGELYLLGDEFHTFAPKGKIMDIEAGKCLHWTNRLVNEGRGLGIVCLLASQRPQKVHNDTLTACETLIALRVIHKADRDAIKDWIEGCGDLEQGKQVLNGLAGLPRGEAFVWSPEIEFGPERVKFPMFKTFDSFAPPQLQKTVLAKSWASVDLEAVKAKLATVIEEHKQNDPGELKRTIAQLKRDLAKQPGPMVAPAPVEPVEVPVLDDMSRATLEMFANELKAVQQHTDEMGRTFHELLRKFIARTSQTFPTGQTLRPPAREHEPRKVPGVARLAAVPRPAANGEALPKAERSILRVLANFPDGKTRREIGVIAGYKHTGGGFNNALGALRGKGFVVGSDPLRITEAGLEAFGPVEPLPSGQELYEYWMQHPELGRAEREILRVLYTTRQAMPKEAIAPLTISDRGMPYESNGGGFNNAVGRLRTYELIDGGRGELKLQEAFFQ